MEFTFHAGQAMCCEEQLNTAWGMGTFIPYLAFKYLH